MMSQIFNRVDTPLPTTGLGGMGLQMLKVTR